MVKRILLILDDEVFEKLKKLKGSKSWYDFLITPFLSRQEQSLTESAETDLHSGEREVQQVKSSPVEIVEPIKEEADLPPEVEEQISEVTEQAKMEEEAKTKRKLKSYLYSPYCPICQLTYANVRPIFSEKASGKWVHRIYVKCDKCGAEFLMKLDKPWPISDFKKRFERETSKFVGEEISWESIKREYEIEGLKEE